MILSHFKQLHRDLMISLPKTLEFNPIASDTDPTQDIPIRNIEMAANGMPLNVKDLSNKMPFNNVPADQLCSIDKRNTDKFDQLGELQQLAGKIAPVAKTDYKPFKKQMKHEN